MPWPPRAPTALELYAVAKSSLPRFLFAKAGVREPLWAAAKIFERVGQFIDERYLQTFIGQSTGIWVDQHLADRGMLRTDGESDELARERARRIEDAATPEALVGVVNALLEADGVSGEAALVELAPDKAWMAVDVDGRLAAYLDCGFRMDSGRAPRLCIFILPYGTSPETAESVAEALRKLHAAGYPCKLEIRRVP